MSSALHHKALIRAYKNSEKDAVVELFRLNTPIYFSPDEEKDLIHYLEHEIEHYFVVEMDGKIVGCGGFNFSGHETVGKISWDIFHPDFQGKSLGTLLLKYRIEKLQGFKNIQRIIVRTSQVSYLFYKKQGFTLLETIENYWAKGFHLYKMEYNK